MYLDSQLVFARNEDVFASAGTNLAGSAKDTKGSALDMGATHKAFLVISVSEDFAGAGTIEFQLRSAATEGGVASGTIHYSTGAMALSALTLGDKIILPAPVSAVDYADWLGIVVVGSDTTTAGAINAFFTFDAQNWDAKPAVTGSVS